MRWVLAGLSFALAVSLAIGTVAIRADNTRERHRIEVEYRAIQDRMFELRRLSMLQLQDVTPERLAAELRRQLQRARRRPLPSAVELGT
jgi:hypothetical protein